MMINQLDFPFYRGGDKLLLASSAFCLAISLLAAITVIHTLWKGPWKVCECTSKANICRVAAEHHVQTVQWIRVLLRAVILLSCLSAVAAFICVFALHGASAQFHPNSQRTTAIPDYCSKNVTCPQPTIYYIAPGFFDRETWACQFGSFPDFDTVYSQLAPDLFVLGRVCVLDIGVRWLSIFLAIFSVGLSCLFYVDWKGDRVLIRTWKDRSLDWEDLDDDYV